MGLTHYRGVYLLQFANISRSSRSTQFSGRSRVSSSRSLVIKQSQTLIGRRLLDALRIALAESSNSRANSLTLRLARAYSMMRHHTPARMVDGFSALGTSFLLSPRHRLRKRVNFSRGSSSRHEDVAAGAWTQAPVAGAQRPAAKRAVS